MIYRYNKSIDSFGPLRWYVPSQKKRWWSQMTQVMNVNLFLSFGVTPPKSWEVNWGRDTDLQDSPPVFEHHYGTWIGSRENLEEQPP